MGHLVGMGLPGLRVGVFGRAALAQALGQRGKAAGGQLGDVAAGFFRPKAFGVEPDAAQQRLAGGQIERVQRHVEGFGRMAGKLRVDADGEAVANHQNRRVAQRQAVAEQLLEGGVEAFAGRLVFPGKGAGLEHVGITGAPANDAAFFLEQVTGFAAGLGHAQQLAQVKKMALRALLFVQAERRAARAPFLDEVLGGHAGGVGFGGGGGLRTVAALITAKEHIQSGFNFKCPITCRCHAGSQLADIKHANAQRVKAKQLAVNFYRWVKAICQPRNDPGTYQRHAYPLYKPVKQVALDFKHERKVVAICRDGVGVDVKTSHGLWLARIALLAPATYAL